MIAGQPLPDAQQNFLRQVLGLGLVADHTICQMKDLHRIPLHQPLERLVILARRQVLADVFVH